MSQESLVEVTFLQHQDIFFFCDFSPAGNGQCTQQPKLKHSCRRVFFLITEARAADGNGRGLVDKFVSVCEFFVFLFRVGRAAGIFVSTATNVAVHAENRRGGQLQCACAFMGPKAVRVEMWLDHGRLHLEVKSGSPRNAAAEKKTQPLWARDGASSKHSPYLIITQT